jgi:hypothetical protein
VPPDLRKFAQELKVLIREHDEASTRASELESKLEASQVKQQELLHLLARYRAQVKGLVADKEDLERRLEEMQTAVGEKDREILKMRDVLETIRTIFSEEPLLQEVPEEQEEPSDLDDFFPSIEKTDEEPSTDSLVHPWLTRIDDAEIKEYLSSRILRIVKRRAVELVVLANGIVSVFTTMHVLAFKGYFFAPLQRDWTPLSGMDELFILVGALLTLSTLAIVLEYRRAKGQVEQPVLSVPEPVVPEPEEQEETVEETQADGSALISEDILKEIFGGPTDD